MKKYKKINSKKIIVNEYVQFYRDKLKLPNGKIYDYYITNKDQKSVFILPVDDKDRILILKEYRYPVDREIYGPVAGKVDKHESVLKAARRELKEETGYTAKAIKPLGKFYATPARSNTLFYSYTAHGLTKGVCELDETEVIKPVWLTISKFEKLIRDGKVMDPYLLDMYLHYKLKFKK